MTETEIERRLLEIAVIDAADAAADANGNGQDAERKIMRGNYAECIQWLELLEKNAKRAAFHARLAIERIQKTNAAGDMK